MVTLLDAETDQPLGQIAEEQLHFLMNHLQAEDALDQDYYVGQEEIGFLEEAGADRALLATLRSALAGREGMDIRYVRDQEEDYR